MKQSKILILTTLLLFLFICACKTKSECPAFNEPSSKKQEKDGTKYKLILLKDGKKVRTGSKKRNKKPKQKLFKKKVLN
tara:strand:- start:407 stop:643 length:237 start_codon:yes stop_codon:yes gene_type:complete